MPSRSPAQHKLFQAVAGDPQFADQVGIPQAVGRDFMEADQRAAAPQARNPFHVKKIADALKRHKYG